MPILPTSFQDENDSLFLYFSSDTSTSLHKDSYAFSAQFPSLSSRIWERREREEELEKT